MNSGSINFCSRAWSRTKNLPVNSRVLCQLSYAGLKTDDDGPCLSIRKSIHRHRIVISQASEELNPNETSFGGWRIHRNA